MGLISDNFYDWSSKRLKTSTAYNNFVDTYIMIRRGSENDGDFFESIINDTLIMTSYQPNTGPIIGTHTLVRFND
jgi:hypothetical protein